MTRILYMSDLHLEMERWRLTVPGWAEFMARHHGAARHPARGPLLTGLGPVDLVVLAGDIHNGFRGVIYADHLARYLNAPVVVVAGNHEFYHHDTVTLLPALREAATKTDGRVQFLENSVASFTFADGPLNVLGCTLWTDYQLHGTPEASMRHAQRRMNDHSLITTNHAKFTPADALRRHRQSRLFLHAALPRLAQQEPAARNVIVTHHAPGGMLLGKRSGDIAPCYGSDLLAEFSSHQPTAWIHGHSHYRHEGTYQGIRVLSAPRGYVGYDGDNALNFKAGIVDL